MEKAFDNIGVYDFWGVFWAGVINLTTWLIMYAVLFPSSISNIIQFVSENIWICLVLYIVLSHFLGDLLHEIGRFLRKIGVFGDRAIFSYLSGSEINKYLKEDLLVIIKKEFSNSRISFSKLDVDKCEFIYDYCYEYLKSSNIGSRSDRILSIYGLSRSLCVGHALFSVIFFAILLCFKCFRWQTLTLLFITILSTVLFFFRTKFYDKCIVKNVITMYCIDRKKHSTT